MAIFAYNNHYRMNGVTTKSIIILLLLLAAASCSRHSSVSDTLAHAEAVMEEHPDSALSILQSVPDSALVTDRDRALHALLLSQALDKTRSEVENDSLILSAIEYFDQHSDNVHLATANTYYSRYLIGMGRYDEAMPVALDGLDEAISVEDTLLMARLHEIIADIYYLSYDVQKELEHRDYAVKYYKSTGHELSYKYSLIELARCYNDNYREQDAKSLLDSVAHLFSDTDSLMTFKYKSSYLPYLIENKDYDTAKNTIKEYTLFSDEIFMDEDIYCAFGEIYLAINELDSVKWILSKARNNPNINNGDAGLNMLDVDFLVASGDYKSAYQKYDSIAQLQNRVVEKVLRDNVEKSCSDYYLAKKNEQLKNNEQLRFYIIVGIGVIFIGFVIIFLIIKLKFRQRDLARQEYLNEIQLLIHKLDEEHLKRTIISEKSLRIEKLIDNRFVNINRLCHEYYEKKDSPTLRNSIYKSIEQEIISFSSKETLSQLEEIINQRYNNILIKVRSEIPILKDKDIYFIVYIASGFSPRSICLFAGFKIPNYYAKKTRLKSVIASSEFEDKGLLLDWLS